MPIQSAGLGDGVVNCPECGFSCDIPRLIALQLQRQWRETPLFTRLTVTVLLTVLALPGLGVLIWFIMEAMTSRTIELAILATAIALLLPTTLGWIVLIQSRRGDQPPLNWAMVARAHVIVLTYIMAMFGLPALLLICLVMYLDTGGPIGLSFGLLALAGIFVMFRFARRWERQLAEACIRRYLDYQHARAET